MPVYELGWLPTQALRWDAGEDSLEYDCKVPIACMTEEVQHILVAQSWEQSSRHDAGEGMQRGVGLSGLSSKAREHEAQGQARGLHILQTIVVSGSWTQERAHKAGLTDTPICPRCQEAVETHKHRYYQCPPKMQR